MVYVSGERCRTLIKTGVNGSLFVFILATRWQKKTRETRRGCSGGSVGGLVCEVLTVSEEVPYHEGVVLF